MQQTHSAGSATAALCLPLSADGEGAQGSVKLSEAAQNYTQITLQ